MTRFCKIRRLSFKKNPFVFKGHLLDFANFSKFILGRNVGNQSVAVEKIWNRRFMELAGGFVAMAPRLAVIKKATYHDSIFSETIC
jgi:hypothetical protein